MKSVALKGALFHPCPSPPRCSVSPHFKPRRRRVRYGHPCLRSDDTSMAIREFLTSVAPCLQIREWRPARVLRPQHELDVVPMWPCTVPFAECIAALLVALQRVFGVRFCRVESIESLRQEPNGLRLTLQPHTDHKPRPELVSNGPQHPLAKDRIYPHITRLATSIRVKVHVAEQRIRIFAARCPRLDNRARQQTYLAPESSFVLVGRAGVPHSRRWKLESLSGRFLDSAVWRSAGEGPSVTSRGLIEVAFP